MNTLSALLSRNYTPTTPQEFIGSARRAAIIIDKLIARATAQSTIPNPQSQILKLSLIGPPGVGKSMLCKYTGARLNCLPFEIIKYAGRDVDIERVRSIADTLQYQPSGPYRLIWVDEADGMTQAALQRMLPLLDDLPPRNAFILTANSDLSKIEERFHTRFKLLPLTGPSAGDITDFLFRYLGPNPSIENIRKLKQIAEHCGGNVRAAIDDLDTALLSQ